MVGAGNNGGNRGIGWGMQQSTNKQAAIATKMAFVAAAAATAAAVAAAVAKAEKAAAMVEGEIFLQGDVLNITYKSNVMNIKHDKEQGVAEWDGLVD